MEVFRLWNPYRHSRRSTTRHEKGEVGECRKGGSVMVTGEGGLSGTLWVTGLKIGYARVSTDDPDLTAQRDALAALGVDPDRVYVDHGLTGTNRDRPGLREAMAACRAGDALVVTKLDRLARSLPDARDIVAELTARDVALSLGGSVHDPTDPVGRLLFNVLAMVAEFEVRSRPDEDPGGNEGRPRQGAAARQAAQAQPASGSPSRRAARRRRAHDQRARGSVTRSTVYRALARDRARATT